MQTMTRRATDSGDRGAWWWRQNQNSHVSELQPYPRQQFGLFVLVVPALHLQRSRSVYWDNPLAPSPALGT